MSYASCWFDGSNIGIMANLPYVRESCSSCEECIDGSSATSTTMPPLTPVIDELMNGSAATFNPTCFIHTMERFPEYDIPRAHSIAVFSFDDHNARMLRSLASLEPWMNSIISVDGVPG